MVVVEEQFFFQRTKMLKVAQLISGSGQTKPKALPTTETRPEENLWQRKRDSACEPLDVCLLLMAGHFSCLAETSWK
jgi:hypothetical protein